MKRSNHLRKYNARYFRLNNKRLSYYTTPESKKPRRTILIGSESSIRVVEDGKIRPKSRLSIIMRAGQNFRESHRELDRSRTIVLTISDDEKSGSPKYKMILCPYSRGDKTKARTEFRHWYRMISNAIRMAKINAGKIPKKNHGSFGQQGTIVVEYKGKSGEVKGYAVTEDHLDDLGYIYTRIERVYFYEISSSPDLSPSECPDLVSLESQSTADHHSTTEEEEEEEEEEEKKDEIPKNDSSRERARNGDDRFADLDAPFPTPFPPAADDTYSHYSVKAHAV